MAKFELTTRPIDKRKQLAAHIPSYDILDTIPDSILDGRIKLIDHKFYRGAREGENGLSKGYPIEVVSKSEITEDVVAQLNIGDISPGDVIDEGTTLTDFVKMILQTTFQPTLTTPSISITPTASNYEYEAGTVTDITFTINFNRGQVLGDLLPNGAWDSSALQMHRAGEIISASFDGNALTINDLEYTVQDVEVEDGLNQWNAEVSYDEGGQPLDSEGNAFSTPYPSGSVNTNINIYGRRKLFYGTTQDPNASFVDSFDIRELPNYILNPLNGLSFTINIPVGAAIVCFAYPDTLNDVSSVTFVEGMNAEVSNTFSQTVVPVSGSNDYNPIPYKVYTYTPVSPFSATATYNITI